MIDRKKRICDCKRVFAVRLQMESWVNSCIFSQIQVVLGDVWMYHLWQRSLCPFG